MPIVSDPLAIRHFIMYDALAKRDPFEGYKAFCKAIGNPEYDYVDYEFHYYRFYGGNLELDYDRSLDPVRPNFTELPNEMLVKVVEKLGVRSRLTTRKVSRKLRLLCSQKSAEIEHIDISVVPNLFQMEIDDNFVLYSNQEDNNCTLDVGYERVNSNPNTTTISGNYLNLALDDLSTILEIPKQRIRNFSIFLESEDEKILAKLQQIVGKSSLFHAKFAFIRTENGQNLMEFLRLLKPGHLEKFIIGNEGVQNLSDLFEMEQFKQARQVDMSSAGVLEISNFEKFLRFEKFKIQIQSIDSQGILEIRNKLLGSAHVRKAEIFVHTDMDMEEIRRTLGSENEGHIMLKLRIPNSKDDFLQFSIHNHFIKVEKVKDLTT